MGAGPSRSFREEAAPKRKRTPRTKKNKGSQTNTKPTADPNTAKPAKNSPSGQLKQIVELVCDKKSEHERMSADETSALLKQIRDLSVTTNNA